jgi:hypothetical protein
MIISPEFSFNCLENKECKIFSTVELISGKQESFKKGGGVSCGVAAWQLNFTYFECSVLV